MFQRRLLILSILLAAGFAIILGRLVQIQVLHGQEYRNLARDRRTHLRQIAPRRGRILDRNGRILAVDRESFDLRLTPARIEWIDGKRTLVSQLPPLTAARLLHLLNAADDPKPLERNLAVDDLVRHSPLVGRLAPLLDMPPPDLARSVLDAALGRSGPTPEESLTQPRRFLENVSLEAFLAVEQANLRPETTDLAALDARIGSRRVYPAGRLMGHITGTVGHLNAEDYTALRGEWVDEQKRPGNGRILHQGRVFFGVEDESDEAAIIRLRERRREGEVVRYAGYFLNEMVGRSGVEEYYNQRLRGRHVLQLEHLVRPSPDAPRQLVPAGHPAQPVHGEDIALTIDLAFQRKVRDILLQEARFLDRERPRYAPHQVACVMLDPRDGKIHALVSVPGYDPNTLREDWKDLLKDPRKPLLNQCIQGEYPPGSTMKPLVALAALQEGKLQPDTTFNCQGEIHIGRYSFPCMNRIHHGTVDVRDALMRSCNVFFYLTGGLAGPRTIHRWASYLGLGHRTGIDLAGEVPGHLPEGALTGEGWTTGRTYHFAIGQGPITATPLQMAVAYAAIANGGRIVRPHLLLPQRAADRELIRPRAEVRLDPAAFDAVRQGMWQVVQGERGTAKAARLPGIDVAGKTGSAEWKKGESTHAWFGCYAPFEAPEVVCIVLVPRGKYGGSTCAPIARRLLMLFFDLVDPEEGGALG